MMPLVYEKTELLFLRKTKVLAKEQAREDYEKNGATGPSTRTAKKDAESGVETY